MHGGSWKGRFVPAALGAWAQALRRAGPALRYESGKKIVTERQSYGRGYTPWSHKARTYILEIIKERAPIGTVEIAKITGRNRSSIHSDTLIMEDEGVIKRRKRGRLVFWEVA